MASRAERNFHMLKAFHEGKQCRRNLFLQDSDFMKFISDVAANILTSDAKPQDIRELRILSKLAGTTLNLKRKRALCKRNKAVLLKNIPLVLNRLTDACKI